LSDQSVIRFPRFYLTAPAPCPYLPGRHERKVFTYLSGELAPVVNDALTNMGFRRSQSIAYKPACDACSACVSVRIPVAAFTYRRSFKRIQSKSRSLTRTLTPARSTAEQYNVLKRYLQSRHADGGMADMGLFDYAAMVEDTPIRTQLVEYRDEGKLAAVCLTDRLNDGFSMVYSFFDPDLDGDSLGTYMVLDHVALAREHGLPHVYLGYWIEDCRKMAYKARFSPLEALGPDGWERLDPEKLDPNNRGTSSA
jgi:arginine-tRNA-protein transferase